MEKLNINQWAEEDRPREKMMALGPQALSDAELLAILSWYFLAQHAVP